MHEEILQNVEKIKESFPHLESQIDIILNIFGERRQKTYGSLFVYGQPGTGKTSVIQALLQRLSLHHVYVNLVDCFTPQILFENVLNKVSGVIPCPSNKFSKYATCHNIGDFVSLFVKARDETDADKHETTYVVLDKAELLRDMPTNVLGFFLRLQELTGRNVCVILISQLLWEKFHQNTGTFQPLCLHFPDLTRSQLVDVLALQRPPGFALDFYKTFLQLVLSVFYTKCKDLKELQYLCRIHFAKYIEPLTTGEATIEDSQKLWRHIQPILRDSMQSLYLREVSSAQWDLQSQASQKAIEEEMASKASAADLDIPLSSSSQSTTASAASSSDSGVGMMMSRPAAAAAKSTYSKTRVNVELPFFSKFLLAAAYIASYNPQSTDRRFFCKNAGKLRKQIKQMKKLKDKRSRTTTAQLLGPKAFPIDRLMAIFYSIVDERVPPSANILSQLSSLVTLKLIANAGTADSIDAKKFKACVSLEFIQGISKTIHFDINHYLYDML